MQKSKSRSSVGRVAILLMVLVLCAPFLVGCADFFFERQNQKDMEQIVASIPLQTQYLQTVGGTNTDKVASDARTIDIRKGDLLQAFNSKAESLLQEPNMTYENAVRVSLDELTYDEIEQAYVEIEFDKGDASRDLPKDEWEYNVDGSTTHNDIIQQGVQWIPYVLDSNDQPMIGDDGKKVENFVNINNVLRQVYQALQNEIFRVGNEILTQRGEDARPDVSQPSPTTPPNQVKPKPDAEPAPEPEEWKSEYYPGDNHDAYEASLDKAAFRRVINNFGDNLDGDFRLTDADRNDQKAQIKAINDLIDQNKYQDAYLQLGIDLEKLGDKSILYYAVGKEAYKTVRQDVFTKYINSTVDTQITNYDIQKRYNDMLASQQAEYNASPSNFNSYADGDNLVLYEPTSELFWVKHVLLEFNDDQKAQLKFIQATSSSKEEYNERRDLLAKQIKVTKNVNGFNSGNPIPADEIYNEIAASMKPLVGSTYEASEMFDNFIYAYNADGGIFGQITRDNNDRGYMVQPGRGNSTKPGDEDYGIDTQWVPEFAHAAKDLRQAYDDQQADNIAHPDQKPKSLLGSISGPVVTDNGIHILYLSDVTQGGQPNGKVFSLDEYTTASHTKTVRQAIRDILVKEQQTNAKNNWRTQTILQFNPSKNVVKYENRFKDVWEKAK